MAPLQIVSGIGHANRIDAKRLVPQTFEEHCADTWVLVTSRKPARYLMN